MKTMTCQQLGGPCQLGIHGETADEIIKAYDRHLHDAVEHGDEPHRPALEEMTGRWKRPISGMRWYRTTKRQFAELADDR